mmetsp:Transcript_45803/g.132623  ORF Transcript_45803/g.132623 Transcript_45803/m.132623 type:complete len:328 (+) Transcript_45803:667-1650(+)
MYADVHRLFLQLAKECPAVRELARARLRGFIVDPAMRTQECTPSLGRLVHYLLVAEEVTWEELAPVLLPEALRRHALRQRSRGWAFDRHCCRDSKDKLINAWDAFAMPAGLVTCFCAMFYKQVGRPWGATLGDVATAYDRQWGRLRPEITSDIMSTCARLSHSQSLVDVLEILLPAETTAGRMDRAVELILWADKYGRRHDAGVIKPAAWPSLTGRCPLLHEWQARHSYSRQQQRGHLRCRDAQRRRDPRHHRAWRWTPRAEVQSVEEHQPAHWGAPHEDPQGAQYSDDALWVSRWQAHPDLYPLFLEWLQAQRAPYASAPLYPGMM